MTTNDTKVTNPAVSASIIKQAAEEVADPREVVEAALLAVVSDPGALLEENVLDALRAIRSSNPAEFARIRERAKKANKAIRLGELDKLTRCDDGGYDDTLDRLIRLAQERCGLHHDADRKGVAIIERGEHREVWMVERREFSEWLRAEYFKEYEAGVADSTLRSAIGTVTAIGVNRGNLVEVHLRSAKQGDAYYIDLCDERWRVIEVDRNGWRFLDRSPVFFTRNDNMRPLPSPVSGGDFEKLWKYANVPGERRALVTAWLMDSMRPDTPYPVLEIVGEQGTAKSTTQRHLRTLLDPNKVPLRGAPDSSEDIFVAAASSGVVSYENLSFLRKPMQDAICTLSTGGGFATRKFYTNGEEHVLMTKRPVMLNGISGVCTQPDLIERSIRVDAPRIAPTDRCEEAAIERGWSSDVPGIFGGLLDRFSATLAKLPAVDLEKRQRMADFERLGEADLQSQGAPPGKFSELYAEAVKEGTERALETYGIVEAMKALLADAPKERKGTWSGTVKDLLSQLDSVTRYGSTDRSNWPRSAKGLSDQLRRLAPALRAQGVEVDVSSRRSSKGRHVTISLIEYDAPDDGLDPAAVVVLPPESKPRGAAARP